MFCLRAGVHRKGDNYVA
nr:hypothetical protein [Klebsiella pneumoniae subsp. pneumoniae]